VSAPRRPPRVRTVFLAELAVVLLSLWSVLTLVGGDAAGADPGTPGTCPSPNSMSSNLKSFGPSDTFATTGTPHTATAVVVDAGGAGIAGICVQFTKNSGPSTVWPRYLLTDKAGQAAVDWTSSTPGTDSITASTTNAQGQVQQLTIRHTWTPKPTSPPPSATPSPTPSLTPSATPPQATTSPTPSPAPSSTAPPSPSPSTSPTASPVPLVTPSGFADSSLHLGRPSALPGGTAALSGRNCPAGSTVTYSVEGSAAGSSTALPDGTFSGDVQLPDVALGRHLIEVTCGGRTASVPIDLVVSSGTSTPALGATTGAILVFFVLFISVLFGRTHQTKPKLVTPEESGTPEPPSPVG
jgi:hypothetical protein